MRWDRKQLHQANSSRPSKKGDTRVGLQRKETLSLRTMWKLNWGQKKLNCIRNVIVFHVNTYKVEKIDKNMGLIITNIDCSGNQSKGVRPETVEFFHRESLQHFENGNSIYLHHIENNTRCTVPKLSAIMGRNKKETSWRYLVASNNMNHNHQVRKNNQPTWFL